MGLRIGMVGVRFAGLDGVTLESKKVAVVLESLGHDVFWFGGRLEDDLGPGKTVPRACFDTPENLTLSAQMFGSSGRREDIDRTIEAEAAQLQEEVASFVSSFGIDILMPQNAAAIPMQVPLGVAIARLARSSSMPVLAHHHDFSWERERFWPNCIEPYLEEAFPAVGPEFKHLVINSPAQAELRRRTGATAAVLPNIMDFRNRPAPGDAARFRDHADIDAGRPLLLQPTRMVPRKGIEDTLRLAQRLGDQHPCVVVTHPEPDEGSAYIEDLFATATDLAVDFRSVSAEGSVSLADAYAAADLVTYPSRIEGFGNALLEAVYFQKPLLVNRYPVFVADIEPAGLEVITMDGAVTDQVVDRVRDWIDHPDKWAAAVVHNYQVAQQKFSYETAAAVLERALADLA